MSERKKKRGARAHRARPESNPDAQLRVVSIAPDGMGVAESAQGVVHIAGAAPGDVGAVDIVHVSRQHGIRFARPVGDWERGPAFVKAPCHHAAPLRGACGGCPLMHVSYAEQLHAKRMWVNDALAAVGGEVHTVQRAPHPLGYRNRTRFVAFERARKFTLGSRGPRDGELSRMDGCLVVEPAIATAMARFTIIANELSVPVWREGRGVRYVTFRVGDGDAILCEMIVGAKDKDTSAYDELGRALVDAGFAGVVVSTSADAGNAIRGVSHRVVSGVDRVKVTCGGLTFSLGVGEFFQLNTQVAETMAGEVAGAVAGATTLWDLYCGAGLLGLMSKPAQLFGADLSATGVATARDAARRAGVTATFTDVDLEDADALGAACSSWSAPDAVIVNPPRRGCSDAVLEALVARARAPIVYMSCDVVSLARDARRLIDAGRRLEWVRAYDMLAQTRHVELLARFSAPETT